MTPIGHIELGARGPQDKHSGEALIWAVRLSEAVVLPPQHVKLIVTVLQTFPCTDKGVNPAINVRLASPRPASGRFRLQEHM